MDENFENLAGKVSQSAVVKEFAGEVMNNDTGLAWHCSSLRYFICNECTSKLHLQYWFSLFGLLLLYDKITDCQQAASRRCKAARRQPNRDVRDSSRGRRNLGLM